MNENSRLYAEDLHIEEPIDLGTYVVTHDEIVGFAGHWDPQPFHTDDEAASRGYFGEVIASGVHTLAVFQRLAVLGAYRSWAIVAGRTIREIQLTRPVRAGMTLHGTLMVVGVEFTRPDRALVIKEGSLTDDSDEPVLSVVFEAYVRRRPTTENDHPAEDCPRPDVD